MGVVFGTTQAGKLPQSGVGVQIRSGLNMGGLPDLLLRRCPNSLLGTLDDKQVVTLQSPSEPDKSWQS